MEQGFRKALKKDKEQHLITSFHEDLDTRSKWMGLKWLRKGYTPAPYHRQNQGGRHIPMHDRAEEAANYLCKIQWGLREIPDGECLPPPLPTNKVITQPVNIVTNQPTLEELDYAIAKLKLRKSGGPDGTTIELFKAMDAESRKGVLKIMGHWWDNDHIDPEALRARVAPLYKTGN